MKKASRTKQRPQGTPCVCVDLLWTANIVHEGILKITQVMCILCEGSEIICEDDEMWKKREALEDEKWNTWILMVSEALPSTSALFEVLMLKIGKKKCLKKASSLGEPLGFSHLCFITRWAHWLKTYLFCKKGYGYSLIMRAKHNKPLARNPKLSNRWFLP